MILTLLEGLISQDRWNIIGIFFANELQRRLYLVFNVVQFSKINGIFKWNVLIKLCSLPTTTYYYYYYYFMIYI